MSFRVAGARDCKTWVSSISKSVGRRGTFEKDLDLERCIFRGRRSASKRHVHQRWSQGADFLRGVAFWSIRSSALGRWFCDRCSTLYDLASPSRGRRNASETWTGKIAKRLGTRPSGLHSTFHYWRKSGRIASFLTLSSWRSLAELLRFQACRLQIDCR